MVSKRMLVYSDLGLKSPRTGRRKTEVPSVSRELKAAYQATKAAIIPKEPAVRSR